jgi:hypothetical protein
LLFEFLTSLQSDKHELYDLIAKDINFYFPRRLATKYALERADFMSLKRSIPTFYENENKYFGGWKVKLMLRRKSADETQLIEFFIIFPCRRLPLFPFKRKVFCCQTYNQTQTP